MKLNKKPILVILAVVAVGAALIIHKRMQLRKETPPDVAPVVVSVQQAKPTAVTLTQPTVADVLAVRDSVLASRLTGYVAALPFFEGSRFKRGELLAKLDMVLSSGTSSQGDSLAADLAASESASVAASERLQRSRRLHEIGGVSTEQLQADEAAAMAARARLAVARENLRNATLAAPFDGMVSQRFVQQGDLATPGKPLLKIVDTAAGMRLVVNMPEGVAPVGLMVGSKTLPVTPWPEASPQGSRRYEARAPADGFTPGSRAAVKAVLFSGQGILIPRGCTLNSDGRHATVLRIEGKKAVPLELSLQAEGEEGAVTLDARAAGALACASPDILARLEAGVPFAAEN